MTIFFEEIFRQFFVLTLSCISLGRDFCQNVIHPEFFSSLDSFRQFILVICNMNWIGFKREVFCGPDNEVTLINASNPLLPENLDDIVFGRRVVNGCANRLGFNHSFLAVHNSHPVKRATRPIFEPVVHPLLFVGDGCIKPFFKLSQDEIFRIKSELHFACGS